MSDQQGETADTDKSDPVSESQRIDTRSYDQMDERNDTQLSPGMELKGTHAGEEVDLPPEDDDGEEDGPHRLEGKLVAARYEVHRKIGEGGMGSVYLAEHVTIQKKVALKVLLHEHARKKNIKDRFLQEAKAAAKIGHENIVDIIDFGSTPTGSLFFAMEYLEGDDLSKVLQMNGPMNWGRAKPILLQVCRALEAAHAKGIIHRDMKPENVFLEEREGKRDFVKILDFGIAKVGLEAGGAKGLTRTGMVFGTPHYMSPEQAMGKKPDNRVDIYSLGVIVYEMLTGEVPFNTDSFMGILTLHISEQPTPPRELRADIPPEVEAIILKALAKKPEERYQSMAEMAMDISRVAMRDHYQSGETVPPGIPSEPHVQYSEAINTISTRTTGSSRRWVVILGLAALLLGGGMAVMAYLRAEGPEQTPRPGAAAELKQRPPAEAEKPVETPKPAGAPAEEAKKVAAPLPPDMGVPAAIPDLAPKKTKVAKVRPKRRPRRPRPKKPKPVNRPKPKKPKPVNKPPSELIEPKW